VQLAQTAANFDRVDFTQWLDVVRGKKTLLDNSNNNSNGDDAAAKRDS
jgi:hypothetical protein